jgi:hypothetical protein
MNHVELIRRLKFRSLFSWYAVTPFLFMTPKPPDKSGHLTVTTPAIFWRSRRLSRIHLVEKKPPIGD